MFDKAGFMKASFIPRTEEVPLNIDTKWGENGDQKPTITIRGLTASEIALCNEAAMGNQSVDSIIKAIATTQDRVNAIKDAAGIPNGDVPVDTKKRITQLKLGAVEPEFNDEEAVKFAEVYPVDFIILTNKIAILSGLGMDLKK